MNKILKYIREHSVFIISVIIAISIIIFGAINKSNLISISEKMMNFINENFSWLYLLLLPIFLVFLLFLAFSRYGNIKLGGKDAKTEHSKLSWFAMLFCAGTGIGLVFWSIAEPLTHFANPPFGIEAGSQEAADFSIRTCFLHWGILPWCCFALVGLALAYFQFNKKKSASMSNVFSPIIGEKRVNGPIGKTVDVFAIIVSVVGIATSLGLGCMQITGGMKYLFNIPINEFVWLITIVVIALISLLSSITGVNKGIKFLSNANSWLAIFLLLIGFIIGPTRTILNTFTNSIGSHISNFISDSFKINPTGDNSWIMNWRVFYWAWWVAWAPFVGSFIARISKGRTIREFIIAVILIPSLLTFIWFSVFGTIAIASTNTWSITELSAIASTPETAVYTIFSVYSIGRIVSVIIMVLLALFFITSADSATFSLSMLSSNGDENPKTYKKIIWSIIQASMAFILLCSGSIKPLQIISIAAALPFLIIMVFMCFSLIKELKNHSNE